MNDRIDTERLLSEILAEEAPAGFREALLNDTLRLARRRRYVRHAHGGLAGLALMLALLLITLRWLTPAPARLEPSTPKLVIRTQPMLPQDFVETHSLPSTSLIVSIATANVLTTVGEGYRTPEMGDEELLALTAPNPVVLVRYRPHEAELVFADATSKP